MFIKKENKNVGLNVYQRTFGISFVKKFFFQTMTFSNKVFNLFVVMTKCLGGKGLKEGGRVRQGRERKEKGGRGRGDVDEGMEVSWHSLLMQWKSSLQVEQVLLYKLFENFMELHPS